MGVFDMNNNSRNNSGIVNQDIEIEDEGKMTNDNKTINYIFNFGPKAVIVALISFMAMIVCISLFAKFKGKFLKK